MISTFKQCLSTTTGNQHSGTPKLSKYSPLFSTQFHHTLWTNSESNTTFVYVFLYICFKSLMQYVITAELSDTLASLKAQLLLSRAASFLQRMPKIPHVDSFERGQIHQDTQLRAPLFSHSPCKSGQKIIQFFGHTSPSLLAGVNSIYVGEIT